MLSVVIITKNEEANLAQCLESVHFADEIIVVDSYSTDKTIEIAKSFNAKVISTDWPGFGIQKQRAVDAATGDWILSLDADEVITPTLAKEIKEATQSPEINGYYLPRLSHICGKPIRYSGWYPDFIIRLFKKSEGSFTKDLVHEEILVNGTVAKLQNHIMHYSYATLDQFVGKINLYSTLGAENLHAQGKTSFPLKAVLRGMIAFLKLYIFKAGFMDGTMGFIVAISSAESAYYKYLKLSFLNKKDHS